MKTIAGNYFFRFRICKIDDIFLSTLSLEVLRHFLWLVHIRPVAIVWFLVARTRGVTRTAVLVPPRDLAPRNLCKGSFDVVKTSKISECS